MTLLPGATLPKSDRFSNFDDSTTLSRAAYPSCRLTLSSTVRQCHRTKCSTVCWIFRIAAIDSRFSHVPESEWNAYIDSSSIRPRRNQQKGASSVPTLPSNLITNVLRRCNAQPIVSCKFFRPRHFLTPEHTEGVTLDGPAISLLSGKHVRGSSLSVTAAVGEGGGR